MPYAYSWQTLTAELRALGQSQSLFSIVAMLLSRRQPGHIPISFRPLSLEQNLTPKILGILIKPRPMLLIQPINLPTLKFKPTALVRFRRHHQILISRIRRLVDMLLKRAHESDSGCYAWCDLGVLEVEKQTVLFADGVADLGDFVAWSAYLNEISFHRDGSGIRSIGRIAISSFFLFSCCTSCKISLVFSTLSVGQVGSVILVDC